MNGSAAEGKTYGNLDVILLIGPKISSSVEPSRTCAGLIFISLESELKQFMQEKSVDFSEPQM